MKKFACLLALIVALLSNAPSFASWEFEDPSLCVNGRWLVVDAAAPDAVRVTVPMGTRYGDQATGGCQTPPPAPLFPTRIVVERSHAPHMMVMVNGQGATKPVVTVAYGDTSFQAQNHGQMMVFKFKMRD